MNAPEEQWISVSDLMGGFVAVVMVMFVLASALSTQHALHASRAEQRRQDEARSSQAALANERARSLSTAERRRRDIARLLSQLQDDVERGGLGNDVLVDVSTRTIRLQDQTFSSASACVRRDAQGALARWSPWFRSLLERYGDIKLNVNGHTDDREMVLRRGDVVELREMNCALFDDNLTLSAARAREARRVIIGDQHGLERWPLELSKRVTVVGFGSSDPLQDVPAADRANRRIEIHIQTRDERTDAESERGPAEAR
ncbi:MAG: hypothetical protein U0326_07260 [Polyangiales bacterium]